jgi:hypothetical protein
MFVFKRKIYTRPNGSHIGIGMGSNIGDFPKQDQVDTKFNALDYFPFRSFGSGSNLGLLLLAYTMHLYRAEMI